MHLSFLTSHNLLFFRSCKTSKKTTFSVFLSFFLVKLSKSQSLKLNISRTARPILMILVSICRISNGLSDEINLFWRCSSPLTICKLYEHVMCKINNECIIDEWAWLTVYKRFYCIARKWVCQLRLSATQAHFRLLRPKNGNNGLIPKNYCLIE